MRIFQLAFRDGVESRERVATKLVPIAAGCTTTHRRQEFIAFIENTGGLRRREAGSGKKHALFAAKNQKASVAQLWRTFNRPSDMLVARVVNMTPLRVAGFTKVMRNPCWLLLAGPPYPLGETDLPQTFMAFVGANVLLHETTQIAGHDGLPFQHLILS